MSEWITYKIKDITTKVGSGATPRGGQKVYQESGTTLIRSQNVYDFTFDNNGLVFINDEAAEKLKNVTLQEKDILLNITGDSVGRCCLVPNELLPARVNQHVAIIRTDKNNSAEFLMYTLNENQTKERLLNQVHGGTRKALTKNIIEEFEVRVPNLEVQQKIASILKSLDEKIHLNNKINFTLEQIATALYKDWFVDFSPFQDQPFEMSEIGDIPEGWEIKSIKDVSLIFDSKRVPLSKMQREKRKGKYPYYGATSVMDFVDDYIFDGVYLLIGEDGSVSKSDGTPYTQYVQGKIWVNNHAHVLQGDNGISTEWLKIFFDRINITPYVTGAVQPKINQSNLNSIKFIYPKESIRKEFNEKINTIFRQIRLNIKQNEDLIYTRDFLLPSLLSGEIDVSEAAEKVRRVISNEQPEPSVRI